MENLFIPTEIKEYCENSSSPLSINAKKLYDLSIGHPKGHMVIGKIIGNLIKIIANENKASNFFEIGTFLGFTASIICETLNPPGCLYSCEENFETYSNAKHNLQEYIDSGVLELENCEGVNFLNTFPDSFFKCILIDARKESFVGYESILYKKLSMNGLILIDNGLCGGQILNPKKDWEKLTFEFNKRIAADSRYLVSMLPIRDGFTIAQKNV